MRTADLNIATAELDERTRLLSERVTERDSVASAGQGRQVGARSESSLSVGRGRERGDAALPTNNAASVGRSDARAASGVPAAAVLSAGLPQGRADAPRREHRSAA
jgi:hypothetical protein